jgi:hypothetical protein
VTPRIANKLKEKLSFFTNKNVQKKERFEAKIGNESKIG